MIETWIVPCNIKHFDLISHFESSDTVVWKNSFTIKQGDIVYIYIGALYNTALIWLQSGANESPEELAELFVSASKKREES